MPILRSLDRLLDPLGLHCLNPLRYPYLLESAAPGSANARYSMVFAFPGKRLVRLPGDSGGNFLEDLNNWWGAERVAHTGDFPVPFRGGWFVFLGYEVAGQIEPRLRLPRVSGNLPTAFATRIPAAVIVDHQEHKTWLMVEEDRGELMEVLAADVERVSRQVAAPDRNVLPLAVLSEEPPERFLEGVERIKAYIREGDVFQVNLSRAWEGELAEGANAATLYRHLCRANPAPFAGLACWGENAIISSSPERLVRVREGFAETRPIAGTRPRSPVHGKDFAYSNELLAHPKERAEHVMLIDLERNDLGRVCRAGSIRVNELMILESYAHVHHIVSNIRGELRCGITPGEVIRAVFPGGTITGCPKVRCMEIIAELEKTGRGPYTGSMGYLNRDGDMDLNILIRTLVKQGSRLQLRAGGGIVADSVAERELDETRAKARGLLLALGAAG